MHFNVINQFSYKEMPVMQSGIVNVYIDCK